MPAAGVVQSAGTMPTTLLLILLLGAGPAVADDGASPVPTAPEADPAAELRAAREAYVLGDKGYSVNRVGKVENVAFWGRVPLWWLPIGLLGTLVGILALAKSGWVAAKRDAAAEAMITSRGWRASLRYHRALGSRTGRLGAICRGTRTKDRAAGHARTRPTARDAGYAG